jgi:hypothetical protein
MENGTPSPAEPVSAGTFGTNFIAKNYRFACRFAKIFLVAACPPHCT